MARAYAKELQLALRLAREAGRLILGYQAKRLRVGWKPGHSPVTRADREVERFYLKELQQAFPHDRILGEESGHQAGSTQRFWTIDPIDGTRRFIAGENSFCTMLALVENGKPVLSVVAAPAKRKLFYAVRGHGAYEWVGSRFRRMHIAHRATRAAQATVNPPSYTISSITRLRQAYALLQVKHHRTFGGATLNVCAVAAGRLDGFIGANPLIGPWDVVPTALLVTEAGGTITDFFGKEYTFRWSHWGGDCGQVAGNPKLVRDLLRIIKSSKLPSIMRQVVRSVQARTTSH